jgi:hypothetical protein
VRHTSSNAQIPWRIKCDATRDARVTHIFCVTLRSEALFALYRRKATETGTFPFSFLKTQLGFNKNSAVFYLEPDCVLIKTQLRFKKISLRRQEKEKNIHNGISMTEQTIEVSQMAQFAPKSPPIWRTD